MIECDDDAADDDDDSIVDTDNGCIIIEWL